MPDATPGFTKNLVRRMFRLLVDHAPTPQEITAVWEYFASSCAYCGVALVRAKREGRLDHRVPAAQGGTNGIGNLVLACGACNDKEKRDLPWEEFLRHKSGVDDFAPRRQRILEWGARA